MNKTLVITLAVIGGILLGAFILEQDFSWGGLPLTPAIPVPPA